MTTAALVALGSLTLAPATGRAQAPVTAAEPAAQAPASTPDRRTEAAPVALQLQPDEVEAVLAILDLRAEGAPIPESAWRRLFAAEGYTRMMEREKSIDERMGLSRGFTDEKHRQFFATDPALLERREALHDALDAWKHVRIQDAGERALAYLPAGTRIRGTIYPLLREATNSFVFQVGSDNPAIFMYVDPGETPRSLENTLTHEFHHLGVASACPRPPATDDPRAAALYDWTGGFAEGLAVLAAAGSPDADPLPDGSFDLRQSWAIRQDSVAADMAAVGDFFLAIRDGRLEGDELARTGFSFINRPGFPQGPFYTLGWFMASTVEREMGRAAVIDVVCAPANLLQSYNRAAETINGRSRRTTMKLPLWSPEVLEAIGVR